MVRYRRNFVPGGTFFFTLTLDDRRSSVLVDHVTLLRAAFRKTRSERPFSIDAIVILPEHLHVILTLPPDDPDFSNRLRRIKGRFTRSVIAAGVPISRDHRGEYSLWQKRFWEHTIRDDRDFERCVDYIHYNPVKHRLVATPSEWPYSSLHRYVRTGVLAPDWGGDGREDDRNFGERGD
jgi:putative transposase